MERLTKVVIVLVVFNTGLFFLARDDPAPDLSAQRLRITTIEQTLPLREANMTWYEKAKPAVETVPQEEPNALVGRLRDLASGWHFEVTEAANRGGDPPSIMFAGHGSYQAVAALIGEIERCDAARLDSISLVRHDADTLDAAFEVTVRHGPWKELPFDTRPEPATETPTIHQLGNDPFSNPTMVIAAPVQKPALRFTGYFSSPKSTTAFVEVDSQVILATVGASIVGGARVVSITQDLIALQDAHGDRWTYEMEKAH